MSETYDLIVIGGGSAGLVAAGGAAILGAKVALIEKKALGGDCLYTGCVPSKTLIRSARLAHDARRADKYGFERIEAKFKAGSFASITGRVHDVIERIEEHDAPEVFEKMGVEVIFGTPCFVNPNELDVTLASDGTTRRMTSRRFCVSTGSRPFIPPIDGLDDAEFITNEEIFDLTELPKRMIVLGGGPIGIELGQAFARLGSKVTVVEMGDRILSKEDSEVSSLILEILGKEGIEFRLKHKAVSARRSDNGAKILTLEKSGKTTEIEADEILVAVGRTPNLDGLGLEKAGVDFSEKKIETNDYLQTSQRHIYAAGDVTGNFPFTHMADYEARVVIQNAFTPFPFRKRTDFRVVPWATFTNPEIGRVGFIESDAKKKFGDSVEVIKVAFDENDRAHAEGSTQGFAKVVTHKGRIIGATVVGEHAGELIHEFVWAVKQRMKVADLDQIIHVYPTLGKIVQAVATESTLGQLRSPFVQKWFRRYLKLWRWI